MSQTPAFYQHPSNSININELNEQPRQPFPSRLEPLPPLETNQNSHVYQLPVHPNPIQRASLPNDYTVWSIINTVCSVLFSLWA